MTVQQTFAVDRDAVARFPIGDEVNDLDRHGQAIKGRVVETKLGNRVALVIVQAREESR
jgi:hypothetical protein